MSSLDEITHEAHNARTKLSFETLERSNPSCIIEFTATPQLEHDPSHQKYASNVLAHCSAAQLKAEEMIKLPIKLHTGPDWQAILADTVQAQRELEDAAKNESAISGEYIRPIVLLQAQPHSKRMKTITVEVVKKALLEDCKVPEDQVAIATGATREIEDIDLFDPDCPIRFIITQQALKEGWDCSFAYIFCSVADIGSTRDAEQLLGRILRLPQAKSKHSSDLNQAYAMISSHRFIETLGNLTEALIENGFEAIEAHQFVSHEQYKLPVPGTLWGQVEVTEWVPEEPNLSALDEILRERVAYYPDNGTLTVSGVPTNVERTKLERCFITDEGRQVIRHICDTLESRVATHGASATPMKIPALCLRVDGQLELFEESLMLDAHWDLADCDVTLTDTEFPSKVEVGTDAELDISDAGKIVTRAVHEVRKQLSLLRADVGWTLAELTNWLDRNIVHTDIVRTQSSLFIYRVVEELISSRGVSVEQLAGEKYRLRNAIAALIDGHRKQMRESGYQKMLFGSEAEEIEVSPERAFVIAQESYAPNWYYEGSYQFEKHAFSLVGELKSDGEEFQCAQFIDQLRQVHRWVRNLERRQDTSFWLQTPSDKFYPDFIAELDDGRILVVESKGEHLWSSDDSKEKRAIGDLWADRSKGDCLFVMPKGTAWTTISETVGG